jgi:hypothetical protein
LIVAPGDLNDVEDTATLQPFYGPEGTELRWPEDVANPNGALRWRDDNDAQRLFNARMLTLAELPRPRINRGDPRELYWSTAPGAAQDWPGAVKPRR